MEGRMGERRMKESWLFMVTRKNNILDTLSKVLSKFKGGWMDRRINKNII